MTTHPIFDLDTVDRLLTTTRAVRRRLDLERPVPLSIIEECLALAIQAPTGNNLETWRWIVITDPGTKEQLGELYRAETPSSSGSTNLMLRLDRGQQER